MQALSPLRFLLLCLFALSPASGQSSVREVSADDKISSLKWHLEHRPAIKEFYAKKVSWFEEGGKTREIYAEFGGSVRKELFFLHFYSKTPSNMSLSVTAGCDSSNYFTVQGNTLTMISREDTNVYSQQQYVRGLFKTLDNITSLGFGQLRNVVWRENQFSGLFDQTNVRGELFVSNNTPTHIQITTPGSSEPFLEVQYTYLKNDDPLPTKIVRGARHEGSFQITSQVEIEKFHLAYDLPPEHFMLNQFLGSSVKYTNLYADGTRYTVGKQGQLQKARPSSMIPGPRKPPQAPPNRFNNGFRILLIALILPISLLTYQKLKKTKTNQ